MHGTAESTPLPMQDQGKRSHTSAASSGVVAPSASLPFASLLPGPRLPPLRCLSGLMPTTASSRTSMATTITPSTASGAIVVVVWKAARAAQVGRATASSTSAANQPAAARIVPCRGAR